MASRASFYLVPPDERGPRIEPVTEDEVWIFFDGVELVGYGDPVSAAAGLVRVHHLDTGEPHPGFKQADIGDLALGVVHDAVRAEEEPLIGVFAVGSYGRRNQYQHGKYEGFHFSTLPDLLFQKEKKT
ncbi:MAG: hypothetical protein DRP42_05820 [Tenericutes bacterium]|nr:MAG: hypothetical protein DRP42_05820 [Mycoplasmatota bacterium]